MSSPAGRDRRLLTVAAVALTVVAGLYLASGLGRGDEAWSLQVLKRVTEGDVLYRDVFFTATPLSVWLAWPLVALLGVQAAWLKLLVLAAFAAALALVVGTARRLGASLVAALLLGTATLVLATPHRGSLYQPLATVFLLACLSATLAWLAGDRRQRLLIAAGGAAAGLAFASKQNVGLYALAALLGAVLLSGAGGRLQAAGLASAGFAACALLPLVPVVAAGGFDAFVDYAFTSKGTSTDRAGISYVSGLLRETGAARDRLVAGDLPYALLPAYHALLFALVPAVLVLLALACFRSAGEERRRVAVLGLFALAAAAAIFPRADAPHLVYVSPVILLAGWYAADLLLRARAPHRLRAATIAAAVFLAPGMLVLTAWPALQILDRGARPSGLPHARGILLEPEREERMRAVGSLLSRAAPDGRLFLVVPDAALYYLVSGVENPTPYDYPLASAFGRTGEGELEASIRRGELSPVCLGMRRSDGLVPRQLVRAVRTALEPAERTGVCRVHRFPRAQ